MLLYGQDLISMSKLIDLVDDLKRAVHKKNIAYKSNKREDIRADLALEVNVLKFEIIEQVVKEKF
jgi:hypothetical protein